MAVPRVKQPLFVVVECVDTNKIKWKIFAGWMHVPSKFWDGHILQSICSCDERCRILGDCCVDAPRECFGAENDVSKNFHPVDNRSWTEFTMTRSMYSCRTLQYIPRRSTVGIFMNNHFIQCCPDKAPYSRECEANFIYKTLAHRLPVCHPSSSLLLSNRFCAACHGFNFEDTVSFYHRISVCDQWLALNHTKEKLLENITGA